MTKTQKAWETMRQKQSFHAKDIMRHEKDNAFLFYLNALERTGYIVQKQHKKTPYDREYILVRDTGEKAPVYQTSRTKNGVKYEAMVKDKNISREYHLVDYPPIKRVNPLKAELLDFAKTQKKFSYREALELFRDETHPKGYKYSLFHYYLDQLLEEKRVVKTDEHQYIYNFKKFN